MIGFLHPWVLAGLAAAAIPILLHLVARRQPPTVVFPAVRYLVTTTREHQRRLRLQNWLLLVVRTLLIAALVFAAAGPTVQLSGVPGHAPSALVLIVDNSASSGAVVAGTPRLTRLRAAGREVLARSTPDDALWLITADGTPRRGDAASLGAILDSVSPAASRMDLGAAITLAGDVLAGEPKPGEIVVLSDAQATAVGGASVRVPLVIGRPEDDPAPNVGIGSLATGPQPWSSDGGRVVVSLVGDSGTTAPVSARLGERPPRQALGTAGGSVALSVPGAPSGWWTATAELDPDEFRLDDRRRTMVRVAPVARVDWGGADRHLAAAAEVLEANGRIARGTEVTIGRLGAGASVVLPPEDPAELGALNRALERRGVAWRYGTLRADPTATDSGALLGRHRILRRYTLETSGSGRTGVLATAAGGQPWAVRSAGVVLLASRFDPAWSDLPVSAEFMPLMDRLLNRAARGEVALVDAVAGTPAPLPDLVTEVRAGERSWRADGGDLFRATDAGVHFLLAGSDTVGALSVNVDPRESILTRMPDAQLRRLWRGARVVDLADAGPAAFSSAAVGDLRGPLLWAALALGLFEVVLASAWRRRA
jgi:hypothetical protein